MSSTRTPDSDVARAWEWANRTDRYARDRAEGARRARELSAQHPGSEACSDRAAVLTRLEALAKRGAREARREAEAAMEWERTKGQGS